MEERISEFKVISKEISTTKKQTEKKKKNEKKAVEYLITVGQLYKVYICIMETPEGKEKGQFETYSTLKNILIKLRIFPN